MSESGQAFQRAIALHQRGQLEQAEQLYQDLLGSQPGHFGAAHLLGLVFLQRGQAELAERQLSHAIALKPDVAEAHGNHGNALKALRRLEEALASYDRALALKPDFADVLVNRGWVLQDLKQPEAALDSYRRALVIRPQSPIGHYHSGLVLHELARFDEAVASYEAALALQPENAQIFFSLGNALGELRRMDDALASFDRAIALSPGFAEAYRNRGILKLLTGNFRDGLTDYEHRRPKDQARRMLPTLNAPYWSGENLAGRSILVSDATGMGDAIQLCRYLPLLADRGARVGFLGNRKLFRLFAGLDPRVRLITALDDSEHFDYQCKLLSLPYLFNTELETIPHAVPYLHAETELREKWRARLGDQGFRIGICWKGNPTRTIDAGRSIPLAGFAQISQLPGVRLISLQKRFGLDELDALPEPMRVETLGAEFDEGDDAFVDSAAVIANLDLVISSCTSLPHLAGAIGKPTWVALKQVPEWRWLLDRADSPWYPTMRLFRQPRRGEWEPVFKAMTLELESILARR